MYDRATYEGQLAHALSRHIGYTTGAFGLERLAEIANLFPKPVAYGFELTRNLKTRSSGPKDLSEDYVSEILNFCTGLGLIERVEGGAGQKLPRFRLSQEAVALRAAHELRLDEFHRILLVALLLENDADGYGLLLDLLESSDSRDQRQGQGLADRYLERTKVLRGLRWDWLQGALPQPVLLRRVCTRIPWLRVPERGPIAMLEPKTDFGRHHSAPRKGWAESLKHILPATGALTDDGRAVLSKLRNGEARYSWLGPPREALDALKLNISSVPRGPLGDAWNFLRPSDELEVIDVPTSLVAEVAEFMRAAYPYMRLSHANQASTKPVRMFIIWKELSLGFRVSRSAILERVFREHPHEFAPMSGRSEKMAFYMVRRSA